MEESAISLENDDYASVSFQSADQPVPDLVKCTEATQTFETQSPTVAFSDEPTPSPPHSIIDMHDNFSTLANADDYQDPPPYLGTFTGNTFSVSASDLRRRRVKTSEPLQPTPYTHSESGSSSSPEDIFKQMKKLLLVHRKSALAHTVTSRTYRSLHRKYTFGIMLINTVGIIMQQILQGSNASETVVSIFNSAMFSLVGGLTSINNFLGYASLEMKHLSMRNEHNAIHNMIADAITLSREKNVNIDWQNILEDVREKERTLTENSVQIPGDILAKFMVMSEQELDAQALG